MAKKYAAKCFLGKQSSEFEGRSKVGGEEGEGHSRNVSTLHNSLYPHIIWFSLRKTRKSVPVSIAYVGPFVMFLGFSEYSQTWSSGGITGVSSLPSSHNFRHVCACVWFECVSVSVCASHVCVSAPSGCQSSASSLSLKSPKRAAGSSCLSVNISH